MNSLGIYLKKITVEALPSVTHFRGNKVVPNVRKFIFTDFRDFIDLAVKVFQYSTGNLAHTKIRWIIFFTTAGKIKIVSPAGY